MGVERFDVLLRDATSGVTIKREWSKVELLRSVGWLKRMNARGNNIYVRPNGKHGLALIDSLSAEDLASMRSKGFAPAISIEVRRNEFQAWVKLSDRAMSERLRRLAEAGLASAFGGTPDKVARNGYGWLSGCANYAESPDCWRRSKVRGQFDCVWISTAAHGQTIFWTHDKQYLATSGGKAYR